MVSEFVLNNVFAPIIIRNDSDYIIDHIIHISDLHLHLHEKHDECRTVFRNLFNQINTFHNKIIVVTGDIVHSKLNLSTELIALLDELIYGLDCNCPVFYILGNHDVNAHNIERPHALTTFFNPTLPFYSKYKHSYLLDTSGVYIFHNVAIQVTAFINPVFTPANLIDFPNITHKIALYHGGVGKYQTENGYHQNGATPISQFDGYDAVLLGDIHYHQYLDSDKRIAYAGSLMQQNRIESFVDHGFIHWDLINGYSKFYRVYSPGGKLTILIMENGIIRFQPRFNSEDHRVTYENKSEILSKVRWKELLLKPQSVIQFILPQGWNVDEWRRKLLDSIPEFSEEKFTFSVAEIQDSVYNPETQNDNEMCENTTFLSMTERTPFLEYFQQHTPMQFSLVENEWTPALTSRIMEEFDTIIEFMHKNPDKFRNRANEIESQHLSPLCLKSLCWSNLLCYGTDNRINFKEMDQIGIFLISGKNHEGKSAIVEILLYALFGKTILRNLQQMLGNHATLSESSVEFEYNGEMYKIVREIKMSNNQYRQTTQFYRMSDGNWLNQNEDTVIKTNLKIVEMLGNMEVYTEGPVFLQGRADDFFHQTPATRKDYLMKKLNMPMLDELHTWLVKRDSQLDKDIKAKDALQLAINTQLNFLIPKILQSFALNAMPENSTTLKQIYNQNSAEKEQLCAELDILEKTHYELLEKANPGKRPIKPDCKKPTKTADEIECELETLETLLEECKCFLVQDKVRQRLNELQKVQGYLDKLGSQCTANQNVKLRLEELLGKKQMLHKKIKQQHVYRERINAVLKKLNMPMIDELHTWLVKRDSQLDKDIKAKDALQLAINTQLNFLIPKILQSFALNAMPENSTTLKHIYDQNSAEKEQLCAELDILEKTRYELLEKANPGKRPIKPDCKKPTKTADELECELETLETLLEECKCFLVQDKVRQRLNELQKVQGYLDKLGSQCTTNQNVKHRLEELLGKKQMLHEKIKQHAICRKRINTVLKQIALKKEKCVQTNTWTINQIKQKRAEKIQLETSQCLYTDTDIKQYQTFLDISQDIMDKKTNLTDERSYLEQIGDKTPHTDCSFCADHPLVKKYRGAVNRIPILNKKLSTLEENLKGYKKFPDGMKTWFLGYKSRKERIELLICEIAEFDQEKHDNYERLTRDETGLLTGNFACISSEVKNEIGEMIPESINLLQSELSHISELIVISERDNRNCELYADECAKYPDLVNKILILERDLESLPHSCTEKTLEEWPELNQVIKLSLIVPLPDSENIKRQIVKNNTDFDLVEAWDMWEKWERENTIYEQVQHDNKQEYLKKDRKKVEMVRLMSERGILIEQLHKVSCQQIELSEIAKSDQEKHDSYKQLTQDELGLLIGNFACISSEVKDEVGEMIPESVNLLQSELSHISELIIISERDKRQCELYTDECAKYPDLVNKILILEKDLKSLPYSCTEKTLEEWPELNQVIKLSLIVPLPDSENIKRQLAKNNTDFNLVEAWDIWEKWEREYAIYEQVQHENKQEWLKKDRKKVEIVRLMSERGFLIEQLRELTCQQAELSEIPKLRERKSIYEAMNIMLGKHGFPFYLICQKIKNAVECLNQALSMLSDFKLEFKLNMNVQKSMERSEPVFVICRNGLTPYDISLGSGFERFLVAILWRVHATRMFYSHRTLPMNWLIFDESFHFWDTSNTCQLELLFQHLSKYVPHILLITHIQQISDFAQHSLKIHRAHGLSYVHYPEKNGRTALAEEVDIIRSGKISKKDGLIQRAQGLGLNIMKPGKNGKFVTKTNTDLELEINAAQLCS